MRTKNQRNLELDLRTAVTPHANPDSHGGGTHHVEISFVDGKRGVFLDFTGMSYADAVELQRLITDNNVKLGHFDV